LAKLLIEFVFLQESKVEKIRWKRGDDGGDRSDFLLIKSDVRDEFNS
jgi:hypothetical protein